MAPLSPDRFEDRDGFLLAGLRRRHSMAAAVAGVAEQWQQLLAAPEIPGRIGAVYYGALCGGDAAGIEYLAGVEVASFEPLAAALGRMRVPPQRYAVFRHPPTAPLVDSWRAILAWLEEGPFASAHQPDFELYRDAPGRAAGQGVEIWVGVVER